MTGRLVRHRHRDTDVAIGSMRRERFLAIEDPMIAIETRDRLRAAGIAAGFRFGQAPCADLFAFRQRHYESPALILISGVENMSRAERIVSGNGNADRSVDAREFFDDCDVLQIAESGASVLRGNENAEETQLRELSQDVARKCLLLVP